MKYTFPDLHADDYRLQIAEGRMPFPVLDAACERCNLEPAYRDYLKGWLTFVRVYLLWRGSASAQEIATLMTSPDMEESLRDRVDIPTLRLWLTECEAIYAHHLRIRQLDILIASLPNNCEQHGTPQERPEEQQSNSQPSAPDDDDPHRFNLGDVLRLRDKLQAQSQFAELLDEQNRRLKQSKKGLLTPQGIAFIACLWRKNVRTNRQDPGAVPFDAVTKFCERENGIVEKGKAPSDLQISAALRVLEGVQFMKQVRRADRALGKCAAYALMNEAVWQT